MKKKAEMAGWAVLVFVLVTMMGCGGGGSGSTIQSSPLTPVDRPVVVSGLEQQPTNGPTGKVSFKMHVYDVGTVKSAVRTPMGGGPVDYQTEYRQRVANVGITFWDEVTAEWRYSFSFAVINGDVIAQIEGLIPGAYRMTANAVSGSGVFTFFSGETTVEVVAEKDNHVKLIMDPCQTAGVSIAVSDLPTSNPRDAQILSMTTNGNQISSQDSGYVYDSKFYFWAQIQLYPEPATKLQYSVKDGSGKVYVQEVSFNILDFIDNIIAASRYEITYVADTSLTIDIVWAPAYTVSLTPTAFNGVRPIVAGSTGVEILSVDITVKKDPVAIQKIELGAISSSSMNSIALVMIFDESTIVGSGMFMNGSDVRGTFIFNSVLEIPAYSIKTLTVKLDFAPMSFYDDTGHNIRLKYLGSSGTNMATGESVEDKTPLDGQITADVFRSVLRISALPLPTATLQNGTNVLYRFADSANAAGDIDVFRKTVRITRSAGILINNLRLVDESTGVTTPLTDANSGGEYGFNFEQAKTIAAGTQKAFALTAEVSGVNQGSWLVTEMLGDQDDFKNLTADQAANPQFVGETNNNFIWSDRNKQSHDLNSQDWHNGALVEGFPLPPAILTK